MAHAAGSVRRLRSLLWKPRLDEEVADELAFHLEMRGREYAPRGLAPAGALGRRESAARGWAPAGARGAARRRFGDLAQVKAACNAIGRGRDRAQRRALWL